MQNLFGQEMADCWLTYAGAEGDDSGLGSHFLLAPIQSHKVNSLPTSSDPVKGVEMPSPVR